MALAILRASRVPGDPGTVAFAAELGSNRYYQYVIGDGTVDGAAGFPQLAAPVYTSPVLGPVPAPAMGRVEIVIPRERLDRSNRSVQLATYRTRKKDGPAFSDIVTAAVGGPMRTDLPLPAFGMSETMLHHDEGSGYGAPAPWRGAVPMSYREVAPFSNAMLFGSLLPVLGKLATKVLPKVLPKVMPLIGKLAGAGAPGTPDLTALLQQVAGGAKDVATAPPNLEQLVKPETLQAVLQLLQQLKAPQAGGDAQAKALAADGAYSHAAVAPALLAALPALMPLLEKVATPETIKALLEHTDPTKVIGAVTEGVKAIGNLGLQHDKQENEHLRALNPMGVHAPVDDLLKGLGLGMSAGPGTWKEKGDPRYRRVETVTLTFAGASPVMIHGRSRVCYRIGEEIAFAFDVKTPRPIPDARLELIVKDPATRAVRVRRTIPVGQVANGKLPVRAALLKDDVAKLAAGEEYLVCACLMWKTRKGAIVGTSRMQLITLVGEYIFDRVGAGKVAPLNNVHTFRPFWHKVWQGSFDREHFKVDFEGKYTYVLEPTATTNAPIETTIRLEARDGRVKHGRLRSGMTTSLGSLNALIPQISTAKPLGEAQLKALAASDFVARFNTAARFRAALSGRDGVTGALWVYPEVTLHEVVLLKAASTDADAHVRDLVEEKVMFPIPASIHVIGARTTQ
jgi:hypothetical protein